MKPSSLRLWRITDDEWGESEVYFVFANSVRDAVEYANREGIEVDFIQEIPIYTGNIFQ